MSLFSNILELIPPPGYMTMPSIGVDISDTSMKYICFKPAFHSKQPRTISQWGDIDIPAGVLDGGKVLDPKKLVEVLKGFKDKTKAEFIRVSLPEERVYIFETEIKKNVPEKEIRNLLEFRLEENVPISARDAIFDYDMLRSEADSQKVRVVVAAYQRETILKYYDVCKEAGLTPLAFEVEAQAMARAVTPLACPKTAMLVDFGKTRTGVGIVNEGSSTIDIGGGQLSQVMRKVKGDISEEEITKIKNTIGLVRQKGDSEMHDALISTISVIKDEIASRMQYWHQNNQSLDNRRIEQVVLCGGSVNLKGLPEYLTESLGVKCVRARVWDNAFKPEIQTPPIERRYSYGYATAIGLALKDTV